MLATKRKEKKLKKMLKRERNNPLVGSLMGKTLLIRTRSGSNRTGVLTSVEDADSVDVCGKMHFVPLALILDGRESDSIPWAEIQSISIG